jgi:hypothetical protein
MRRPVTDDKKKTRRGRTVYRPAAGSLTAAEREQERFRELAYRLVYCTDPDEQARLKNEVLRAVIKRSRQRAQTAPRAARFN